LAAFFTAKRSSNVPIKKHNIQCYLLYYFELTMERVTSGRRNGLHYNKEIHFLWRYCTSPYCFCLHWEDTVGVRIVFVYIGRILYESVLFLFILGGYCMSPYCFCLYWEDIVTYYYFSWLYKHRLQTLTSCSYSSTARSLSDALAAFFTAKRSSNVPIKKHSIQWYLLYYYESVLFLFILGGYCMSPYCFCLYWEDIVWVRIGFVLENAVLAV
jgi:hypothetical protein